MVAEVMTEFSLSCAHRLDGHDGPCSQLHGHTYVVQVFARGPVRAAPGASDDGMVMDFGDLKGLFMTVVHSKADHALLNDVYPEIRPTAENLAATWLSQLHALEPRIVRVRVWEGARSFAEASL